MKLYKYKSKRLSFYLVSFFLFWSTASITYGASFDEYNKEDSSLFEYLEGTTPKDQLFLGMFTYHFTEKSRSTRNWQQDLIGLQYNGFFLATFENSFYNRSWVAGIAREIFSSTISNNWTFITGYRLGGVYGYNEGEAPFANYSPVVPVVELFAQSTFREHFGVELMLTTSISLGFFYQF